MGKKKTIAELRKKAKSMRFYNRIGLKKVPWLGLSLAILLDMALFKILPQLVFSGSPFDSGKWNVMFLLIVTMFVCWWTTQMASTALRIYSKGFIKSRFLGTFLVGLSGLLLFPVGICLLGYIAWKREARTSLNMFGMAFILFLFALAGNAEIIDISPFARNIALALQLPLLVIGFCNLDTEANHRKIALPLLIVALCLGYNFLLLGNTFRQRYIQAGRQTRKMLCEYSGQPDAILEKHFNAENESLKSLVPLTRNCSQHPAWEKYRFYAYNRADTQSLYKELAEEMPDVREQLMTFASQLPMPGTNDENMSSSLELEEKVTPPEIDTIRYAARYLALEIRARAKDKVLVEQNNETLKKLRDWIVQGSSSDHKHTASTVEILRLCALTNTLPHNQFSHNKWQELLGEEPDWKYVFACAYAANYQDFSFEERLLERKYWKWVGIVFDSGVFFLDLFHISPGLGLLAESAAHRAEMYERIIRATLDKNSSHEDICKIEQDEERSSQFGLHLSISGNEGYCYRRKIVSENVHKMAVLSWRIMEYARLHNGKLPDFLEDLGETPLDSWNKQPFAYKHGDIPIPIDSKGKTIMLHGFTLDSQPDNIQFPNRRKPPACSIAISLE